MKPEDVCSGTPLVYSKDSPALSTGSSPTTPAPRTSWRRPWPSVMRQWRVFSCTVSAPLLVMETVYAQKKELFSGDERSATKCGVTTTSILRVTARYMGAMRQCCSDTTTRVWTRRSLKEAECCHVAAGMSLSRE